MRKKSNSGGGLTITSITDGGEGEPVAMLQVASLRSTADTTTTTTSNAVFEIDARQHDGANNKSAVAAGGNLFGIQNNSIMQLIVKDDGSIYTNADQTAGLAGTFDTENDVELARATQLAVKGVPGVDREKLNKLGIMDGNFLSHNRTFDVLLGSVTQIFNGLVEIADKCNINKDELLTIMRGEYA